MDWYKRWIGDYARDTRRLSLLEHGVFTALLDHYYATEEPLPKDLRELERICFATTAAERVAVKAVAEKFFPIKGRARRNARADREIAKAVGYHETLSKQGRRGAEKRWRNKDVDSQAYSHPSSPAHGPDIAFQTPDSRLQRGEETHRSSGEGKPGPDRVRPGLDPARRVIRRPNGGALDLEPEATRIEKAITMLAATPDFPLPKLAEMFHLTVAQIEEARDAQSP